MGNILTCTNWDHKNDKHVVISPKLTLVTIVLNCLGFLKPMLSMKLLYHPNRPGWEEPGNLVFKSSNKSYFNCSGNVHTYILENILSCLVLQLHIYLYMILNLMFPITSICT